MNHTNAAISIIDNRARYLPLPIIYTKFSVNDGILDISVPPHSLIAQQQESLRPGFHLNLLLAIQLKALHHLLLALLSTHQSAIVILL